MEKFVFHGALTFLPSMRRNYLIFSIIISVLAVDQISKVIVRAYLDFYRSIAVLGDFFRLQHSENTGAFLSMGAGLSDTMRFLCFTLSVALFLLGMLVYLLSQKTMDRFSTINMSLLVAGGMGNLIDRATRESVTDFMIFSVGPLHTGVVNVADICITASILALMAESLGLMKLRAKAR